MDDVPTIRSASSGLPPDEGAIDVPAHRLLRPIGEGSYGKIWLAINAMGTYRAVKVVNRSRFTEARPYEREYEGIKNFEPLSRTHEGFVDILQVERNDQAGYFYYVMELADDVVRGQKIDPGTYVATTLSKVAAEKSRLPLKDCLAIGITLAGTLDFLHKNNLVHRDIKSANIVFINGRPKLADIGLVTDIRSDSTYVGTPGFIPPEGPGAPTADIYSLGKVLYEISTGLDRNQFPRLPDSSLLDEPDGAFLEWNEIVLKASDDNVTHRYQSAAELQAHLALVRAGKSVRRLLQFERSIALAKRLGPLAAALLIVAAALLFQGIQARKRVAQDRQRQAGAAVASGSVRLAGGDYLGALPAFLRALEIDAGDAAKERTHRVRFAALLHHSPALVHVSYRSNHTGSAVFGPTSNEILSAQPDRRFAVWDFRDGRVLTPLFSGTKEAEEHAAFDADCRRAVTSYGGTTAMVYDVTTGEQLQSLLHRGWVLNARFSPDGRRVVSTAADGKSSAYVWDLAREQIEFTLLAPGHQLWHAEFSPDGRRVVAGAKEGSVFIWNLSALERPTLIFTGHRNWVQGVTFSPDGRLVATASSDHSTHVFDADSGREVIPPLEHNDHVFKVVFSPDGTLLLTACLDGTAHVWDVATGRQTFPTMYHPSRLSQAAFSPDSSRIVTTSSDGALCVWELRQPKPVRAPALIEISADGLRSATPTNQVIEVRHTSNGRLISSLAIPAATPLDVGLSADGTILFAAWLARDEASHEGREAQVWDVSKSKPRGGRILCGAGLTNLTLAPSGHRLAAFGKTNVAVWDTVTGARLCALGPRLNPKLRSIAEIALDRQGQRLALFCKDSKLAELWNLSGRAPRLVTVISNSIQVSRVGFSPDGRLFLVATSTGDLKPGLAQVYDAGSGAPVGPPLPHTDGVRHAAFSPDGGRVLTCAEDFTAVLWDARTGARLPIEPLQHKESVQHGAFSRDGRWLVTTEKTGTVRLWDASTGSLLAPPLSHPSLILTADFLDGDRQLVTRSRDGQVLFWDFPEDTRPLNELRLIAGAVSGHRSENDRISRMQAPDELRRNWEHLRSLYPADFSPTR